MNKALLIWKRLLKATVLVWNKRTELNLLIFAEVIMSDIPKPEIPRDTFIGRKNEMAIIEDAIIDKGYPL